MSDQIYRVLYTRVKNLDFIPGIMERHCRVVGQNDMI